jgi:hypothetical protein
VRCEKILPETDEFVAVTAVGTTTRTMKHDAAVNTDMPQLFDPFQEFQYTCTSLTNESSERLQSEQNVNEENLNESSGIVEVLHLIDLITVVKTSVDTE